MLSVFFEDSFLETFPLTFAAFQSSICLRFLFGGFFAMSSDLGVRGFSGKFFGPKNPCFSSRKRRKKVLPFFALFFRSSIFVTARFCGGFWATNSVICVGHGFVWFRVCVFVWIYLSESGSSCFFAVLGTLGPWFRGPFSFFSPLPSSSPLSMHALL